MSSAPSAWGTATVRTRGVRPTCPGWWSGDHYCHYHDHHVINITDICCQTARAHRQGAEGSPRLRGDLRVRQPRPGGLRVWHRVWRLHPTRHLQPPPQVRCQPGSYSCFLGNINRCNGLNFPLHFPGLVEDNFAQKQNLCTEFLTLKSKVVNTFRHLHLTSPWNSSITPSISSDMTSIALISPCCIIWPVIHSWLHRRFWFYFSIENTQENQRIIFNIVNISKSRNLLMNGLTPVVKSTSRYNW